MEALLDEIRAEARRGGMDVDLAAYEAAGLDPTEPVLLGSGSLAARIGVFGRDPGRTELELREPFIGKGGQLIRAGLHRARTGEEQCNLDASINAGRSVFWANTVPYKPLGNKAWSVAVKRRFLPLIRRFLVEHWRGTELLTCGNVAFDWFGLAVPDLRPRLREFWTRPDRYEASLAVELDGKRITLHPLPHPSPLNATWYPRFPGLLRARLETLDYRGAT
ncbi:MAG: uracil-DNA glycosylase family protein [Planctomycetota bacterium]|jgi:uracil-DNA glycosylase